MEGAPKGAVQLSESTEKRRAERREVLNQALQNGRSIDEVGAMVLQAHQLYIHTDRVVEEPLKARTRALLEAMDALPG